MNKEVFIIPFEPNLDRPNICYLKGDNLSLLVDAGGGPKTFKVVKNELEKNHLSMPDYVVITHYHWDHSFGIGYYNGISIGTSYTNKKLKEVMNDQPSCIDDLISDDKQPEFCREHLMIEYDDLSTLRLKEIDMIVSSFTIDLGNRVVDIKEVISQHSEGALVVFDHNSETLFIGDASSGFIKGKDFYEDKEKHNVFLSTILKIPFKYILHGHFGIKTREEFISDEQ